MQTLVKGSIFNFSDQKVFVSAYDVGCRATKTAAQNKALIVAALTSMTSGGVLLIPHGLPHNFTSSDFPITSEHLAVWELTGSYFKLYSNQTFTSSLGTILESIRLDAPKAITLTLVDSITDPITYSFPFGVYNNSGSPVISGSSYDVCLFVPGIATPVEATARSGVVPGRKYLFKGLNLTGDLIQNGQTVGGKQIATPVVDGTTTILASVQYLICNHTATIATHGIVLPNPPADGFVVNIYSRSAITTLALSAAGSKTIATGHGITTLAAGASVTYVYDSATSAWYRGR